MVDHIQRIDDIRILKRVFEGRAEGRRLVGKPVKRTDPVDEDSASLLGFHNWRGLFYWYQWIETVGGRTS